MIYRIIYDRKINNIYSFYEQALTFKERREGSILKILHLAFPRVRFIIIPCLEI